MFQNFQTRVLKISKTEKSKILKRFENKNFNFKFHFVLTYSDPDTKYY